MCYEGFCACHYHISAFCGAIELILGSFESCDPIYMIKVPMKFRSFFLSPKYWSKISRAQSSRLLRTLAALDATRPETARVFWFFSLTLLGVDTLPRLSILKSIITWWKYTGNIPCTLKYKFSLCIVTSHFSSAKLPSRYFFDSSVSTSILWFQIPDWPNVAFTFCQDHTYTIIGKISGTRSVEFSFSSFIRSEYYWDCGILDSHVYLSIRVTLVMIYEYE